MHAGGHEGTPLLPAKALANFLACSPAFGRLRPMSEGGIVIRMSILDDARKIRERGVSRPVKVEKPASVPSSVEVEVEATGPMVTFTLRLPRVLVDRLRGTAGDVPLARWIRRAIEERLGRER